MQRTARNKRTIPGSGFPKTKVDGESWHHINYGEYNDATIDRNGLKSKLKRNIVGSTYLRRLRIQWNLSTSSFRIGFAAAAVWISLVVLLRTWDSFFLVDIVRENTTIHSPSNFAVVINTFRRPERLQQTVRHYAETCGRKFKVGQVFVVWADQETEPPSSGEVFFDDSTLRGKYTNRTSTNRVSVEILKKKKDSLNARFEPIPELQTTSVFMVDDDIRVDCKSLRLAFLAWKGQPDSMVGYYPRLASPPRSSSPTDSKQNQFVYHAWPMVYWRQKLNIVLTKASFLHSKYLELYTNDSSFPKEIKDHVDLHRNCEDIAMSMLVAHYTSKRKDAKNLLPARPLYVEASVSDVGLFGGISSGSGHFATRSECLTQLTEILRSQGWASPLEEEFDLHGSSVVLHSPGFWWQSRPSNVFEWLGLANIFS